MSPDQAQRVYSDLADMYDRANQAKQRDWFLVLAADAAQSTGRPDEADRHLARLLALNPHHFLRPFGSFAEALRSPDVQGYVENLRRNYPPDRAAELLQTEQAGGAGTLYPSPPPRHPPRPAPTPALFQPPEPEEPEIIMRRMRGQPPVEPPPPPPPARPRPAPPPPEPPRPVVRPRPAVRRAPSPEDTDPYPPPRPLADVPPPLPADASGSAVPILLFALVLVLTLGMTVYTFARPFLPAEWFP